MKFNNAIKLLTSIIICQLAGAIGSFFTAPAVRDWYINLNKPSFNPPNWIFGPVWSVLFFLMGVSLYLVWSENWKVKNRFFKNKKAWNFWSKKLLFGEWQKINIVLIFATQLILNVLWSIIFFGARNFGLAFFELLMLWFAVLYTIINFYRVSKLSAYILLPYILWVSFAGILNLIIWLAN